MKDSSASLAAFLGSPAFLDDAQVSHAVTSTRSDKMVTCRMSHSFYIKWILFGIILGLLPPIAFLIPQTGVNTDFWTAPLVPKVMMFLIVVLGWYLLFWGMFSRRTITFDFYEGYVTLSKGFPSYATQNIRLADVQELKVATEAGFAAHNEPPPIGHVLRLGMLVEDLKLIKTLDEKALRQVVENLATASNGTLLPGHAQKNAETIQERVAEAFPKSAAPKSRTSWWAFLAFCIAAFGAVLMLFNGLDIGHSLIDRRWPTTDGVVMQSRVWNDLTPQSAPMGRQYITLFWQAHMKYRYEVGGNTYEAQEISSDSGRRVAVAQQYHPGSSVRVSYNPASPAAAVLDTDISGATISWFVAGIVIILGYMYWCRRNFKQTKRQMSTH